MEVVKCLVSGKSRTKTNEQMLPEFQEIMSYNQVLKKKKKQEILGLERWLTG